MGDEEVKTTHDAPAPAESQQKKPGAAKQAKAGKTENVVEFPPAKSGSVKGRFPIPDVEQDSAGALAYLVLNRLINDGTLEKVVGEYIKVSVANAIAAVEPAKSGDGSDVDAKIAEALVPFRKEVSAMVAKKIAAALE